MALVREYLYVPDGLPPADWDEAREGSILKKLLVRHGSEKLARVIEGIALIRDGAGVWGDQVDWLQSGTKATLRVVNGPRSGALAMFERADQAYWRKANSNRSRSDQPAQSVSEILRNLPATAPR